MVVYFDNYWKSCKYMYTRELSKNCMYRGYTYMNLQRFNISLRKRITIFLYLQSWRVFFIINNVHHYLSLFIIYIYWHICIFKLFPFFFPSFCYILKKDESKVGWLFQKLLKGLQIYAYSRNCLYLCYTYLNIQRFKK